MDKLAADLSVRAQSNCLSRRTIRRMISQSKLSTIHPKVIDEIFDKLLKSNRIEIIDAGRYKGCYKVKV